MFDNNPIGKVVSIRGTNTPRLTKYNREYVNSIKAQKRAFRLKNDNTIEITQAQAESLRKYHEAINKYNSEHKK
jgi:hypothetical protein